MSLFDDALGAAAGSIAAVMGETMTVNKVEVTGAIAGPVTVAGSYDSERAGRIREESFDIFLTSEAAAICGAAKGVLVVTRTGRKARVESLEELGGGGVVLHCGPVNSQPS